MNPIILIKPAPFTLWVHNIKLGCTPNTPWGKLDEIVLDPNMIFMFTESFKLIPLSI